MRRTAGIAGVLFLLGGAFGLGLALTRTQDDGGHLAEGPRDRRPALIDEVRHELLTGYYRTISPETLRVRSVQGLIEGLRDPFTDYLTPREYAALRNRTARTYSGVGLTVRPSRAGLIVKAALPGPARAAGIRPGDRIVSIDGRRVRRLAFDRSIELIQGEEGTTVRLKVRRQREGTLSFTVKRREIELSAVRSRMLQAGKTRLGYVRIVSFRASAAEALQERGRRLVKRGARGLVLDLRGNPGGLLSQAVRTVETFVESGVVSVIVGDQRGRKVYEASGNAPLGDVPLVVLVDRRSASAAEIVAAALDSHARAVVAGQRTYGKTSVQSIRELSNGGALKLTTAVFLTPRGADLTARGLRPDVRAIDDPRTPRDEALARATRLLLQQTS